MGCLYHGPMPGESLFNALEPLLERVNKPIQYVGGELNSTVKDWHIGGFGPGGEELTVRWALMYPDAYEVGLPNQGVMILYEVLNERPDALAERTYAVWPDMEAELRSAALPQFTVDGHRCVRDFDVFGVSFDGRIQGPMRNSYLTLETDPASGRRHPIIDGFDDTTRIINGVFRVGVRPNEVFPSPLTLIPSYPDLPMEDVYPRVPHTEVRELYLRTIGNSRIVYIPWDIDRTFWEVMCVDHGRLLRNAVKWATNEAPPVEVDGPGLIDVTVWRQHESMTVHLVNLTNPMMMKGPAREILPLGAQRLRVRLPSGTRARRVQLLTAKTTPRVEDDNGVLVVTVPSIDVHEVVAIDL